MDARDPIKNPQPGDVLTLHYGPEWDAQAGTHTIRVVQRAERHLHTYHRWPDGVVCLGRRWLNEWRRDARSPNSKGVTAYEVE